MASLLMLLLIAIVSREFKLGLEKDIAELQGQADIYAKRHMDAVTKAVASKETRG
jgi:hypothetical protein